MLERMSDENITAAKRTKFNLDVIGLQNSVGKSSIFFNQNFLDRDVRLIEVSEDLISSLENGECLKIIGPLLMDGGDSKVVSDAVLATQLKTFSIKKVETSNAVYIIKPSDEARFNIESASQDHYELKPIAARLERIKELLVDSQYDGVDAEKGSNVSLSDFMTYDELRNQIQASDFEFSAALFAMGVVELQGKMRLLSKNAIKEAIKELIYTIMEHNRTWNITCLNEQECRDAMPHVDPIILNFSLKSLGQTCASSSSNNNDTNSNQGSGARVGVETWMLDQDTLCSATARIVFTSVKDVYKVFYALLFYLCIFSINNYYRLFSIVLN